MRRLLAVIFTLTISPAFAEPTHLAVAVNPPLRWLHGDAVAVSGYLGLSEHHALRANGAMYEYTGDAGPLLAALLGAEDEGGYSGRVIDGGLAWMYFPRKLFSGFSLEAGLLVRKRNTIDDDEFTARSTDSLTVGGRALIGWSWLIDSQLFVSVAGGISVGHETGSESTTENEFPTPMPTTQDVSRTRVGGEGFIRLGAAFDL